MRHQLWATCLMLLASVGSAQQQSLRDVEVMFKAAQQQELVDGDLAGAIAQYKAVVARAGSNRAVAAKALLRMAECYRKQGDAEARRVYERLVREYPEQKEAVVVAQARLGGESPAANGSAVVRKLWTGDILGTISADGRRLSYTDWSSGNLAVHDFALGTDRTVTGNKPGSGARESFAEESAISKDGDQIAYTWFDDTQRQYELRLVDLRNAGVPRSRLLYRNDDLNWIGPGDWSPDGKWLAVTTARKDLTTQLGLVNTANGSFRVLKSTGWAGPGKVFFSPNGKYVAFDVPPTDSGVQRDIHVLAVDGSREIPAVVHPSDDRLMGWSPDGSHVLFASDRSGSRGLWTQAIADGETRGAPQLVKPNIESNWSMGMTRNGALYLGTSTGEMNVIVASVDLASGKEIAPQVQPIQQFVGSNGAPEWSPDGKQLAFISNRDLGFNRGKLIGIWSPETGRVRDLNVRLAYFTSVTWSPDGSSFALGGTDHKGRGGVFIVDAQTGETKPLVLTTVENFVGQYPRWAADGRKIFYRTRSEGGPTPVARFIERDIATGREREIARGRLGHIVPSPDGKWIATAAADSATRETRVLLLPVEGGVTRTIMQAPSAGGFAVAPVAWTRDGKALIISKVSPTAPESSDLWVVAVGGGEPRKLDVVLPERSAISLHPDGRQLAFNSRDRRTTEVWVLENFLPRSSPRP